GLDRAIMAEGTCDVVGTAASVALEAVGHIDRTRRTILIRITGDALWWRPLGECERPGNPNASGSSCFLPRSEERRVGKWRSKRDWSSDVCSSDLGLARAIMAEGTCDVVGTAASVALEAVGHIDRTRRTILIRITGDALWWRPLGECERPGNPNASGSSCFLPPPGARPEGASSG